MTKLILNFSAKVIAASMGCGMVAVLIWFLFSNRTMENLILILFCCGAAVIAIGVLLFGGHSDVGLAPRDIRTAEAIDPKDMAYGRDLLHLSESALIVMVLVGCLVIAASVLLAEFH